MKELGVCLKDFIQKILKNKSIIIKVIKKIVPINLPMKIEKFGGTYFL